MASRSTRSPRRRVSADGFDDEGGGLSGFLVRHRLAVGGLTAFAVAFSYVAANAIWYQPHAHGGAFFETRPAATPPSLDTASDAGEQAETVIRLEREEAPERPAVDPTETAALQLPVSPEAHPVAAERAPAPAPEGDTVVASVQRILSGLNLYEGDVDGLNGPQTRAAIEAYRKMVGLEMSTAIDDQLLTQLGAASSKPTDAAPRPDAPATDMMSTASAVSAVSAGDARIMRIQAGLKAFGNEGIEIDGVVGSRTRDAIHEFQSLFGLPETGQPDEEVYVKMREIGLTD